MAGFRSHMYGPVIHALANLPADLKAGATIEAAVADQCISTPDHPRGGWFWAIKRRVGASRRKFKGLNKSLMSTRIAFADSGSRA